MSQKIYFKINDVKYEHIGDLEYFDGALISLFSDKESDKLFILHWVDKANGSNRWILFPTSPHALWLYLNKVFSNKDLFLLDASQEIKIVDLNGDMELKNVETVLKTKLPTDFIPSEKGSFKKELCPDLENIIEALNKYTPITPGPNNYHYAMAA